MINPPLVALALAIAVLVALLVVVLLRRDPVDAAQGQPVTRTPVEQYSLVGALAPTARRAGAASIGASIGHDRHAIRGFRTGAGSAIVMT